MVARTNDAEGLVGAEQWSVALAELRELHPKASDGILFCVHKLKQSPDLRMPDVREEAAGLGIKLGGRSLHSARVILGIADAAQPNGKRRAVADRQVEREGKGGAVAELERRLVDSITEIQNQATAESRRLRAAVEEAIKVLKAALQ